ncbi:MAG TPA: LysM peptidoglycan-binding domain-containing protein [Candidatus Dormibacteraeota bacterium]|nr:LysM peptidoglycan-binding domain-containing protein [Candidatus Dormibacteraeota bacterium]
MRVHRYLTHAIVLGIAVAMSSYASMDKHFPTYLTARLGAVNAEAVVVSQGGSVGDVSLGRYSTIIKPVSIPTTAPISHSAFTYRVAPGESLATIASKFGVTVSQIRWSNTNLMSSDAVATGDQIAIPPVPGIVVTAKGGDTLAALGAKYQVDPQVILDFNRLRSQQLAGGMSLVIPNGVGGAFPPPPTIWQILQRSGVTSSAFPIKVQGCCLGPYTANGFPAGWCTYYVATKRNVTWRGDAGYWYANAAAQGYAVGSTPKVGSIMVTWESWAGHVAYVEAVNPDGSWVVSEMNWVAFGVIDQRTIKPGQLGSKLVGFIY